MGGLKANLKAKLKAKLKANLKANLKAKLKANLRVRLTYTIPNASRPTVVRDWNGRRLLQGRPRRRRNSTGQRCRQSQRESARSAWWHSASEPRRHVDEVAVSDVASREQQLVNERDTKEHENLRIDRHTCRELHLPLEGGNRVGGVAEHDE